MKTRVDKSLKQERNFNRDKRNGRDYYQAGIAAWPMNMEAVNCYVVVQRLKQVTRGKHWIRVGIPNTVNNFRYYQKSYQLLEGAIKRLYIHRHPTFKPV